MSALFPRRDPILARVVDADRIGPLVVGDGVTPEDTAESPRRGEGPT